MTMRAPCLTDDVRAAVALRHLEQRDLARDNADAYGARSMLADGLEEQRAIGWATWWEHKAHEWHAEALAILPPCDGWEPPAPAFVGGAT